MFEQASPDETSPRAVVGANHPRDAARALSASSPDIGLPPQGSARDGSDLFGRPEVHLFDYFKILYKRRWSSLTAFFIVVVSGAVYTFTAPRIYEARVQLLIDKESTNVVTFKEAFEQNQNTEDYYQTQYKILQSRALARRTINALNLWSASARQQDPPAAVSISATISEWMRSLTSAWRSPKRLEPRKLDETVEESHKIDRLLGSLTIAPIRNSRLVDVGFESPDPMLAATIVNALAKQYIEQNLEFKFMSSKEASDWLGERLGEQRKHVEASEQALQRYREQTDAVAPEDKENIVVQKLADLNAAVTRAKTERIQKEAAYAQIRTIQSDRTALDTFPAILSNTFIQQLKTELAELQKQQAQFAEKLGPRHPEMVKVVSTVQRAEAKLQGEIGKVVQSIKNEYQSAVAQEQSLVKALEQQKGEALALNRKGIEYGVLARDAASNRQIFESLMQRTKETGISGELKTSNIRIIDRAETPQAPARPNVRGNLLTAFFGGLTLAMMVAFGFEYLDSRIKSPDEVKAHLGLPFLGMVPALFDRRIENPLISNGVPGNFSESFRAVRTNVLFSVAEEGSRSVVITSTGPAEGKTVVSANLAIALAQAEHRVLLVDADMRRPRAHTLFGKPQQPGLSNVLVGNAKTNESIHRTDIQGLWVMPAGLHAPNPAELLGSKRFKDLMLLLAPYFDWIVIDTPPVMAVTDSAVIAHHVSDVLFVVGAEMISRREAQQAIQQLENANARFIGVVLNRVDLKHHPYYYGQYYRREYGEYFQKAVGA